MTILGPTKNSAPNAPLTIRRAVGPDDAAAVARLAVLDSTRAPRGEVLLAEVDGRLWAAVSVDDFHAVADPFRVSGELVVLLIERARRVRRADGGRPGWRARLRVSRRRPAPAARRSAARDRRLAAGAR